MYKFALKGYPEVIYYFHAIYICFGSIRYDVCMYTDPRNTGKICRSFSSGFCANEDDSMSPSVPFSSLAKPEPTSNSVLEKQRWVNCTPDR